MSIRSVSGVSVVLPCLDEAASVAQCVVEARQALEANGLVGEVLVVDNGSSDGSPERAREAGARVVYETTPGYGSALTTGFMAATGDVIVMLDADLTYPVDRIGDLVGPVIRDEADVVYGGRLHEATRRNMPWLHRWVGTPALTFLINRACGSLELRDSQSGFRAFRRSTILEMDLRSTGMELNAEMLMKAAQQGLRLREVPTGYRARVGRSKLRTFSDGWRNLRTILLLAPEILLIWPGILAILTGLAMTVASFVSPSGLPVGSLRWQPVFFASIALVIGVLALLAGAILAHTSSVVPVSVRQRYRCIGDRSFLKRCIVGGTLAVGIGLIADVGLLSNWAAGSHAPSWGLALASLAQSLIITGVAVAVFGVMGRLFTERRRAEFVVVTVPTADRDVSALS
jgi:glycosyltransferase involved in cell wall biosynthesis